jgi:nucleoid-associated protein YgaU
VDFSPVAVLAAAASSDAALPRDIRNNRYFMESIRLRDLAKEAFEYGDYDASANYAVESQRYARLSDEYVALQLKIRETDIAIGAARDRIAWALSRGVDRTYPNQFRDAQGSYDEALSLREQEQWDPAIAAAQKVLYILADSSERLPLPAQYTVRTWQTERDCLWNISGYSWVYADPFQWRRLYEANRAKMPEPNNPDLIHPGTVLDIPSIRGEVRQGMWQAGRSYNPLPPR